MIEVNGVSHGAVAGRQACACGLSFPTMDDLVQHLATMVAAKVLVDSLEEAIP